jgi:hypothetical protein
MKRKQTEQPIIRTSVLRLSFALAFMATAGAIKLAASGYDHQVFEPAQAEVIEAKSSNTCGTLTCFNVLFLNNNYFNY